MGEIGLSGLWFFMCMRIDDETPEWLNQNNDRGELSKHWGQKWVRATQVKRPERDHAGVVVLFGKPVLCIFICVGRSLWGKKILQTTRATWRELGDDTGGLQALRPF